MRVRYIVIGVLSAGLLAGSLAWAADPVTPTPRERLASSPLGRLITGQLARLKELRSEMKLTDDQRQQIRAAIEPHRPEIATAAKSVVAAQQALRTQVTAAKADEQAIRAAASDFGKVVGDAAGLASKIRAEVAPLLTDQQKKLLEDFRTDRAGAVDEWLDNLSNKPQAK